MSQARKNLKIAAIICLCLGLIFGALTIFSIIGFVGTTAQGTNGATPEDFVDVGAGAIGVFPLLSIFIKAGETALGFWAGMTAVRGGNVPSQARAAFFANIVSCFCFTNVAAVRSSSGVMRICGIVDRSF